MKYFVKSRPTEPSIASSRAFAFVSATWIVREIRQSDRFGVRPAFVAASEYPCQCVLSTRVGTKLMLIGHQPRSPAIAEGVRLLGDAGHGDRRVGLLERLDVDVLGDRRIGRGDGVRPPLASVRARLRVFPELQDGVHGVNRDLALDARGRVDVHHLEVADEAARPDSPHEPAARVVVDLGDPVGQVERVVVRHAGDAGPELDLLRPLQRGGDEDLRRGDVLPLGGEVLADPGLVKAELVEALDLAQVVVEGVRQERAGRVHRHHEVAVAHDHTPAREPAVAREPARLGVALATWYHRLVWPGVLALYATVRPLAREGATRDDGDGEEGVRRSDRARLVRRRARADQAFAVPDGRERAWPASSRPGATAGRTPRSSSTTPRGTWRWTAC